MFSNRKTTLHQSRAEGAVARVPRKAGPQGRRCNTFKPSNNTSQHNQLTAALQSVRNSTQDADLEFLLRCSLPTSTNGMSEVENLIWGASHIMLSQPSHSFKTFAFM
jgi:hypothetical protein